jgi:hypothetical protein
VPRSRWRPWLAYGIARKSGWHTRAPEAPAGGVTLATSARAGIPDYLDRSPPDLRRSQPRPPDGRRHTRPLSVLRAEGGVPARQRPPRCRRAPATCPTTRHGRSRACSSPWASRSGSPSSTPPPPGGSGPSSPQPPSATSGRRAAPSFLAVPPADPRVPDLVPVTSLVLLFGRSLDRQPRSAQ